VLQAGALAAAKIVGESRAWDMVTRVPAGLAFGARAGAKTAASS
jgi:hypothetical protein